MALKLTNQIPEQKNNAVAIAAIDIGINNSPIEAKFYSLKGIALEQSDKQLAQQNYSHALKLKPTQFEALRQRLVYSTTNNDFVEAAERLNLLYRRHPDRWSEVSVLLPFIMADDAGYQKVSELFSNSARSSLNVVQELIREESQHFQLASKFLLDAVKSTPIEESRTTSPHRAAINTFVNRLVAQKELNFSHSFFLQTLGKEEQKHAGYIFNGEFDLPVNHSIFDWRIRQQAGVEIQFTGQQSPAESDSENALNIRFLGSPVRFDNVRQLVHLPRTKNRLEIKYSTSNLRAPKPLKLGLRCFPARGKQITNIILVPTKGDTRILSESFDLTAVDCTLLELFITNENKVETWQNRYSGSLNIKAINIIREGY